MAVPHALWCSFFGGPVAQDKRPVKLNKRRCISSWFTILLRTLTADILRDTLEIHALQFKSQSSVNLERTEMFKSTQWEIKLESGADPT